jgi:hypothetical protein
MYHARVLRVIVWLMQTRQTPVRDAFIVPSIHSNNTNPSRNALRILTFSPEKTLCCN